MFENFNIELLEMFKRSEKEREKLSSEYVGTEHLLLALLKDEKLSEKVKKFNLTYDLFYHEIKIALEPCKHKNKVSIYTPLLKRVIYETLNENNNTPENYLFHILDEGEGVAIRILYSMHVDVDALYNFIKEELKENTELEIERIGKVLNNYISLDEKVIGRDKEINLIIETLLRKKKNNPLLIGDAGVGKSAIVEELVRKIIRGSVPSELLNYKIIMLEMGYLVSGTRYRGEFEEKLTKIIDEVTRNKNIILFIDEIHTMVNAGAADGAISASDILKPYLARGDIKCIGATTKIEYDKYIVKDKALSRRFENIFVDEPNEEETFNILKNIKDEYINYHKVGITDDSLKNLIHLANTYFPNRHNPDKAIELLDSVMSSVKVKKINKLIEDKKLKLKKISVLKFEEVEKGNFKEALKQNILENKIKRELNLLKNNNKINISNDDILNVLEDRCNIISQNKLQKLDNLSKKYHNEKIKDLKNLLINKDKPLIITLYGKCEKFIDDLKQILNYELFNLNNMVRLDKLYNNLKYYPSSLIYIENLKLETINLIKEITKEGMIEYNNEYISFNNAIFIINMKNAFGFGKNYQNNIISDIVIDLNTSKILN